jgi:hypothetical protein
MTKQEVDLSVEPWDELYSYAGEEMKASPLDFIKMSRVACLTPTPRVSEVPMPSAAEVTHGAGRGRAMTG